MKARCGITAALTDCPPNEDGVSQLTEKNCHMSARRGITTTLTGGHLTKVAGAS